MFKILLVLSSEVWQQAVYNTSAKSDSVTSNSTWAGLNSISQNDYMISYRSLLKTALFVYEKDSVRITKRYNCFNKLRIHYLIPTLLHRVTMSLKAASSPDLLMI